MIEEVRRLLGQYSSWLQEETTLRQVDEWVEITTPYLDRHNDYLQIYAKRVQDGFVLTDNGYIIEDLEQSGCSIDDRRRRALLDATLNGFGVQKNENALEVRASDHDFPLRKHTLVQAMLSVNGLFELASRTLSKSFDEDVGAWLDISGIRYTPSVTLIGKSGCDHRFDFVIPKSNTRPERLLRTINRPNLSIAQSMVFSWIDIQGARASDSIAFAVLNDDEQSIPPNALSAMRTYGVRPIPWSEREAAREELAA